MQYEDYAVGMLSIKGVASPDGELLERATNAIKDAYEAIYWAVAFDIDGTLTVAHSAEIDPAMAMTIGDLLRRSVHVLLISGRGRKSTREAAQKILAYAELPGRYARRLQCITHNGIYWLRTPSESAYAFLEMEELISPPFDSFEDVRRLIREDPVVRAALLDGHLVITEEPSNATYALRVVLRDARAVSPSTLRDRLEEQVSSLRGHRLNVVQGAYGDCVSFDITSTSKTWALEYYAEHQGINLNSILRIGDQGHEHGNDFDLLNHPRGFSVGTTSARIDRCFPVLEDSCGSQLMGVEATQTLLKRLKLFPPLTLRPEKKRDMLKALHVFERDALGRTRKESILLLQRIRIRLNRLLIEKSGQLEVSQIGFEDLFDVHTGGTRLRDWEVWGLPPGHKGRGLFGLDGDIPFDFSTCKLEWSMCTDTAILLRGPKYYWAMTHELSDGYIRTYTDDALGFVAFAHETVVQLLTEQPDLVRFKILLGIMDNVRNILIQLQYAIYLSELFESPNTGCISYDLTCRMFHTALLPHTRLHFDTLFNIDVSWEKLLHEYSALLEHLPGLLKQVAESASKHEFGHEEKALFRRWRECDNFPQNVLAVEIGLYEFESLLLASSNHDSPPPLAVGLAYGGIELPAIAVVIASKRGIPLRGGLLRVSVYGNRNLRERILAGAVDSSQLVIEQESHLPSLLVLEPGESPLDESQGKRRVLILEDNCTTGRTLQTARDLLVRQGADVVGAIVVRYPGTNRYVQMMFPNHGLPDPDVLLSFVRGFVAPSPYTRLLVETEGGENRYLDKLGVFDKSRSRVERYLEKNGSLIPKQSRHTGANIARGSPESMEWNEP